MDRRACCWLLPSLQVASPFTQPPHSVLPSNSPSLLISDILSPALPSELQERLASSGITTPSDFRLFLVLKGWLVETDRVAGWNWHEVCLSLGGFSQAADGTLLSTVNRISSHLHSASKRIGTLLYVVCKSWYSRQRCWDFHNDVCTLFWPCCDQCLRWPTRSSGTASLTTPSSSCDTSWRNSPTRKDRSVGMEIFLLGGISLWNVDGRHRGRLRSRMFQAELRLGARYCVCTLPSLPWLGPKAWSKHYISSFPHTKQWMATRKYKHRFSQLS